MSIVRVPIDQVRPGMYLVGINISWLESSFFKHKFLIKTDEEIAKLKKDGVGIIDVNTDKSSISFSVQAANASSSSAPVKAQIPTSPPAPKPQVVAPAKKALAPTSLKSELDAAKTLRKQSINTLKNIYQSSMDGQPLDQEIVGSIVSDSQDSILRNTHALLSLFHSENQQTDLENHSYNVMTLAIMLGERLDLSDEDITILGSAALLMDIGWSKLPPRLFNYDSSYTDEEFEIVKTHVDLGVDLLEEVEVDSRVVSLVAKHHERTDGKGYFSYENESDIPQMCRILSIADHYNARIRGYYDSPSMIPASVLKDIYKKGHIGSHDIGLVELLVQLVGIYPVSSLVLLNTLEKGMVSKVNWRDPLKPTVMIYYHKNGDALLNPKIVDLYKQDGSTPNVRSIKSLLNRKDPKVDPLKLMRFNV